MSAASGSVRRSAAHALRAWEERIVKHPPMEVKLAMAFGVLIAIMIWIGSLGLSRMDQTNANLEDVLGRRWSKLQLSREALMYSNQNSRITMEIFLVKDKRLIEPLLAKRADNTGRISELVNRIQAQCDSPDEARLLEAVEKTRAPYVSSYVRALHLLIDERKPEAGRAVMVKETTPALYKYHEAWSEFMRFQMDQVDKAAHEGRFHYQGTRKVLFLLIVAAVVAAASIALLITLRMITEMRTRSRAEHRVRELNSELAQRVKQRTLDLAESNEQLVTAISERKSASDRLRLKAAALEAAANAIVITDVTGAIVWVNSAFAGLTGYSADEVRGLNPRILNSGKQSRSFYADLWRTITAGEVWHGEVTNRRKDGSLYEEEMTVTPVCAESGVITHFVAIKQEITARKAFAEALRHAEEKYRALVEEAVVGIFQVTPDGRIISANPAMAAMHGYESPQQLMAEVSNAAQQLLANPAQLQELSRVLEEKGVAHNVELEVYRRDGSKKWFLANLRGVRGPDGTVVRHEGTVQDITERKLAERQVQFLAYYDALTGLPNRTLLRDRLAQALAGARRRHEKVALLFLDIDRFKNINDSLGHSVGDLLLKEVAQRLMQWAREQDTVARLGGDEFLIVLTGIEDVAGVAVAADRLVKTMSAEFTIQGHRLGASCSLGISVFPDHGSNAETLIKNADAAMYCAKENGRNNSQFFTEEMSEKALERITLESSLRLAIERQELFLVYQPQWDLITGKVTGAEALLRWRHSQHGLISPERFIPVAENSGLIVPIGEWVLRTACAQARQWQEQGLPPLPVAVNVSAVQFRQDTFPELVKTVLRETGLPAHCLDLEITESMLLSNAGKTLSALRKLEEMGVRLSIDDFGTGYSSLSYLNQLPVYKLKIDRSFVRNLNVDPDDAAITGTIISMAKHLNLKVTAEGVETEEQMMFLREHACDEVQGYYLGRPLTSGDFFEKIQSTLTPEPAAEAAC